MEPSGRSQRVRALVPQAELYKYSTTLRSLTQGRATHTRRFNSYQDVPQHEVPRLIEHVKKEREELAAAKKRAAEGGKANRGARPRAPRFRFAWRLDSTWIRSLRPS
jgi:hypothetical protein